MKASEFRKLIREEVKKTLTENSAPVITEAAATIPIVVPGVFIKRVKELLTTQKMRADKGEVYYTIPPGKEKELISVVFSNWLYYTFAMDSVNLLQDLETHFGLYDDTGYDPVHKLVKKGLLDKKVK